MTPGLRVAHAVSDEDVCACLPVLRELRPHLGDEAACLAQIRRQGRQGYQLLALWRGAGVVACAGHRVTETLIRGRFFYVDDLVTTSAERSQGLGERLMEALIAAAREQACHALVLDSGVDNVGAHRFYLRQGLDIRAFRFARALEPLFAR